MSEANISTSKRCTLCKKYKDFSLFGNDKSRDDGKFPHCKTCTKERMALRYLEKKEEYVTRRKLSYENNKGYYKERAKEWAAKNPEKRKQVTKRYVANNAEKRYETQRNERLRNPGYYAAAYKARQLRKKQAMPVWADVKSIEALYRQSAWVSKITGIKHHVDHYYPLKSDIVCGLHVGANLRIIPAKVNLRKHNHFPDQE